MTLEVFSLTATKLGIWAMRRTSGEPAESRRAFSEAVPRCRGRVPCWSRRSGLGGPCKVPYCDSKEWLGPGVAPGPGLERSTVERVQGSGDWCLVAFAVGLASLGSH